MQRDGVMDEVPEFLTVDQAASLLQVGRTTAYDLTVAWETSSGRVGLPFVWFGSRKRVPRTALFRYVESRLREPELPR